MLWEVLKLFNKIFFERKFLIMFPKLKPKNPLQRIRCLRNKEFDIDTNFWRHILLCVTVVFVKESWGIRTSLNVVRSTQIFNEIYEKDSRSSQRGIKSNAKKIAFNKIKNIWKIKN